MNNLRAPDTDVVMVFPVYSVAEQKPTHYEVMLVERVDDKANGLALFTEKLLAERGRDGWRKAGDIHRHEDINELRQFLADVVQYMPHVKHIAMDGNGAGAFWIEIQDIIGKLPSRN